MDGEKEKYFKRLFLIHNEQVFFRLPSHNTTIFPTIRNKFNNNRKKNKTFFHPQMESPISRFGKYSKSILLLKKRCQLYRVSTPTYTKINC